MHCRIGKVPVVLSRCPYDLTPIHTTYFRAPRPEGRLQKSLPTSFHFQTDPRPGPLSRFNGEDHRSADLLLRMQEAFPWRAERTKQYLKSPSIAMVFLPLSLFDR